jgi:hypothetical protein
MPTKTFTNLADAARQIERDVAARERRLGDAIKKTARQTANLVARGLVPRAFGELADSLHVDDVAPGASNVVASAPHAEAVELGSRPHTPPLAPLIAWVQLRGMQGITASGRVIRNQTRGIPTVRTVRREAARAVGSMLRQRLGSAHAAAGWRRDAVLGSDRVTGNAGAKDADPAVVAVARAIQAKIAKSGTKPHRFMLSAVPSAVEFLDGFVKAALPDT